MPLYTEETFKKHWMANIVEVETIDKRVALTFPDYVALLNRGGNLYQLLSLRRIQKRSLQKLASCTAVK